MNVATMAIEAATMGVEATRLTVPAFTKVGLMVVRAV